MAAYRTQNRTVLAKIESASGTDAVPTVGANALRVEVPSFTPALDSLTTNEVTGALDDSAPIPGGGGAGLSMPVVLKGSGAAGTAPEWGVLMEGCGLAETLRAADLTGTAQAGAAGSITLAAAATGILVGEVIETTGGTGPGQRRVITAWDNGTKIALVTPNWTVTPDATTTYAVKANALYVPASVGLDTLTLHDYAHSSVSGQDSKRRTCIGAQGNAQFTLPARGLVRAQFDFSGKFTAPTDVAHPGAATYDAQKAIAFAGADIALGGASTRFNSLTFDLGNQVQLDDDPRDAFGVDVAAIVKRQLSGRINPPVALLSVRNVFADFLASTASSLWVRYGTVDGNKLSFYFPEIRYQVPADEDVTGNLHEGIPFVSEVTDGGVYICVH